MKKIQLSIFLFLFCVAISTCTKNEAINPANEVTIPPGTHFIPPTEQLTGGDPQKGWEYLIYGDYLYSGIPLDLYRDFEFLLAGDKSNLLGRMGPSEEIPPAFNTFESFNGNQIVSGLTCMGCHASHINGQFIPGLGDAFSDFTRDNRVVLQAIAGVMDERYGRNSPEWEAFDNFYEGGLAIAGPMITPFKGVNPAFMLSKTAAAHRNSRDYSWMEEPNFEIGPTIPSDVPPLWNLNKKNALYYSAIGRGDMSKHLMTVSLVTVSDTAVARTNHENFVDVLAWIRQLKPPSYPQSIDQNLALEGKLVFDQNCAKCHGSYDSPDSYPNLLVDLGEVGTDPTYALALDEYAQWYNQSWPARQALKATAEPSPGYVAPPLDGIWATAPFLHNGSVPNLSTLLNSGARPVLWKRDFSVHGREKYDFEAVGWPFETPSQTNDPDTYDTTLPGYSNQGHTYGDHLSEELRLALIEYLKTL